MIKIDGKRVVMKNLGVYVMNRESITFPIHNANHLVLNKRNNILGEIIVNNNASIQTINNKKKKMKFNPKRDLPLYFLLIPAFMLLFVFTYIPMYGIAIAFKEYSPYKGLLGSEFVGLKNFAFFLKDTKFWRVFRNTVVINSYFLIFGFPAPIILALSLNELKNMKVKKFVQTVSYLPYFVSWVVVSGLVISILSPSSGMVNHFLKNLTGAEPIYFMGEQRYFRTILVLSGIWKDIGMSSVYYLASLSSVDPQLYESATLDGANNFQKIIYISIPSLRYIAIILLILQIGNLFNVGFEQVFLLSNPLVYDVGDVISTYTYRMGVEQAQFSKTTAIGLMQSILNFIMVFNANKISKKIAGWSMW
jgi:putative aldouronate transport system permease protein